MPRASKKGRISGTARKEINTRRAAAATGGKTEGIAFGRVIKLLGFAQVVVGIQCKAGVKEIHARIPNILSRKGATPITSRDVVTVYVGVDFNPDELIRPSDKFDIDSVLTHKQAYSLVKEGIIPGWMIVDSEGDLGAKVGEPGFEFDHSNTGEGSDDIDGSSDDEIEVDNI